MGLAQRSFKHKASTSSRLAGPFKKTDMRQGPEWARIVEIVKARDDYTCQRCGASNDPDHPTNVVLTVDHIVPVSAGGKNVMQNLTTLCALCHSKKLGKKNKKGSSLLIGLQDRKNKRFGS